MIISYFQKNALQLSDWLELQSRKSRASHGDCLLALSDTSFKGQASNSIIMLWPLQVSVCESKHKFNTGIILSSGATLRLRISQDDKFRLTFNHP